MHHQHKILLVDDEPMIRRSMQKTLVRLGFDVAVAASCIEGLDVFEAAHGSTQPFELALLDLNMPGFNAQPQDGAGLELLSRLVEKQPGLPVIILTAYDEVAKAKDAIARGARDYFVKGRDEGLVDLIDAILD
ncbi:MAG: response regulator [Anaerolineales bacterium]|nr:response regulator [Anaerolineales bacterium]